MNKVYPEHIYEPIRQEIAVSYVRHELRKYLPSLKDQEVWKKIDADIATWFDSAPFLFPVRDFWNGVHGIMMGFKLYNHLLAFITAENVAWEKRLISLNELTFGTRPSVDGGPKSSEVKDWIEYKNLLGNTQRYYENTVKRDEDPIIVTQKRMDDVDKLVVYDGNGRIALAIVQGKIAVNAFVSHFVDERRKPENYWFPTSVLMEINHFAKKAFEAKDEALYQSYVNVLKNILSQSQSAVYEMKDRVVPGESEYKKQLFADLALG